MYRRPGFLLIGRFSLAGSGSGGRSPELSLAAIGRRRKCMPSSKGNHLSNRRQHVGDYQRAEQNGAEWKVDAFPRQSHGFPVL
jgi:hypothetical protein